MFIFPSDLGLHESTVGVALGSHIAERKRVRAGGVRNSVSYSIYSWFVRYRAKEMQQIVLNVTSYDTYIHVRVNHKYGTRCPWYHTGQHTRHTYVGRYPQCAVWTCTVRRYKALIIRYCCERLTFSVRTHNVRYRRLYTSM